MPVRKFRTSLAVCSLLFVACAIPLTAAAQTNYPVRPIRILVPFPPGGAADTVARSIGEQLTQRMGQPVIVDNRSGAGGRLATEIVAKAEPDGHTILVGTPGGISVSPALYKNLPYDPQKDLAAITRVAEILNVMVVHPGSGARNVTEFIEWGKKRPTEIRFGSSGTGQPDHLAGEFFARLAGLRMNHVPYKGGGPALVDLIAGDIQLMFATYATAQPHVQSGRLRMLAITTGQRQPLLPDLPAIAESVPNFAVSNWEGIFAPSKTPPAIIERLFTEINGALKAPELRKRQQAAGIDPQGSGSRAEFIRFVREDIERWTKVVQDAKIAVE